MGSLLSGFLVVFLKSEHEEKKNNVETESREDGKEKPAVTKSFNYPILNITMWPTLK